MVTKILAFSAILAAVEILRRAVWNLFRLENEQVNNVGRFRAVDVFGKKTKATILINSSSFASGRNRKLSNDIEAIYGDTQVHNLK